MQATRCPTSPAIQYLNDNKHLIAHPRGRMSPTDAGRFSACLGNFGVAVMALLDNQSTPSPYKGRQGRTNELARIVSAGNPGRMVDMGVDGGGDPSIGLP